MELAESAEVCAAAEKRGSMELPEQFQQREKMQKCKFLQPSDRPSVRFFRGEAMHRDKKDRVFASQVSRLRALLALQATQGEYAEPTDGVHCQGRILLVNVTPELCCYRHPSASAAQA
jgi:hypothetical protein